MKRSILVITVGLVLGAAGNVAAVNCKQVNKYLQTGRSVKDVSETMVIGEDEVKKCQDEAASQGGDAAKAKAGEKTGQEMEKK